MGGAIASFYNSGRIIIRRFGSTRITATAEVVTGIPCGPHSAVAGKPVRTRRPCAPCVQTVFNEKKKRIYAQSVACTVSVMALRTLLFFTSV